jgi:hypothetical protein
VRATSPDRVVEGIDARHAGRERARVGRRRHHAATNQSPKFQRSLQE